MTDCKEKIGLVKDILRKTNTSHDCQIFASFGMYLPENHIFRFECIIVLLNGASNPNHILNTFISAKTKYTL